MYNPDDLLRRFGPANRDPVVKVLHLKAGQRCKHWVRKANGSLGYETHRNFCNLCFGTGVLGQDVDIRFHEGRGPMMFYPNGAPTPEDFPKSKLWQRKAHVKKVA